MAANFTEEFLSPAFFTFALGFGSALGALSTKPLFCPFFLAIKAYRGWEKKHNCDATERMNIQDHTSTYVSKFAQDQLWMIKRPRICIDLQCLAAGEGNVAPAWYPNVLFNMFDCHPATDCDTNDTTHNPQRTCASLPWCPACQVETIEIYWDLYDLQGASRHSMLNWKQHLAKTCSCHKNWNSLLLCRICRYWWILCCVRLSKDV